MTEQKTEQAQKDLAETRIHSRAEELKFALHLMKRNKLVLVGLAITLAAIVIALTANVLVDPKLAIFNDFNLRSCWNNSWIDWGLKSVNTCSGTRIFPLGTDAYGRDLLGLIILSIPLDLGIAFEVVISAFIIGIVFGSVAAYAGGFLDEAILRVTDIFFALPVIVFALVVVISIPNGRTIPVLTGVVLLTWWPIYVRLIRSQVLAEKEKPYTEALRAVGASRFRILFLHIIPNSIYPVFVQATLDIGGVILAVSTLMFIGLTPSLELPELGNLSNQGLSYVNQAPWLLIFPGLTILIIALGFNLLGDGIRDILDPRLRR
ncbi:MAG: ABC transporter permease [Nitrososphaerales archaeon]